MKIYLTNLGKYNEGELVGEWVELPVSEEELEAVKTRIGINEHYEEMFITDYETDFGYRIGEYDNIEELNEVAEQFEGLDEEEQRVFEVMLEDGYTSEEALEKISNGDYRIYYDCKDMSDVAYTVVEECGYLNQIPENLQSYFDYEAFGRDLDIEGTFYYNNGDYIEIIK